MGKIIHVAFNIGGAEIRSARKTDPMIVAFKFHS